MVLVEVVVLVVLLLTQCDSNSDLSISNSNLCHSTRTANEKLAELILQVNTI